MDLSIIIVNWKSVEYARACIQSLVSGTQGITYEIIVVDSCSGDDCEGLIGKAYPDVNLLQLYENVGFARSNNAGARLAQGRFLLFLNPDTIVEDGSVRCLVEALDRMPRAGAAGPRLLNDDGTVQLTCVQPFPTILNQLLSVRWLEERWPSWKLWGREALYRDGQSKAEEVEVVSGACILVRREVFAAVEGFGEEYFMYAEESDLCEKVRLMGWKVLHVPGAVVVHFGGHSTKSREDHFSSVVMRESIFRLFRKFRGTSYANTYRACMLASSLLRLTLLGLVASQPFSSHLRQTARCSFRRWTRIARWSLALEPWANAIGRTQAKLP